MLKDIIEAIRAKMKTEATPGKTLINTRKLTPAKKAMVKAGAIKAVTKGRRATTKGKK